MDTLQTNYTHDIKYPTDKPGIYLGDISKATKTLMFPSFHSLFREFSLTMMKSTERPFPDCNPIASDHGINNAKNIDNKGLIVFIHGLNSNPDTGRLLYKKEIEQQTGNEFEIWVPTIPKRGNCSLEEAAKPVLEMVKKYIETNPGKPVQLIGHSNGGRIAAYVETHLRDKDVNMRITGIAGVFFGSDLITLYKSTGTAYLFLARSILRDLQTGSEQSKKMIEDMRKEITIGSREYTFYATVNDIAIPNFTSSLPNIGQNEECHLLSGCGHNDIKEVVCKQEIEKVIDYLRRHRPNELTDDNIYSIYDNTLSNEAIISA